MKAQELKRIARFALFGAIGFGTGGILSWLLGEAQPLAYDLGSSLPFVGPPATGLFGGAALGVALGNWRKAIVLALLGAIGFTSGAVIPFSMVEFGQAPIMMSFVTMGAVGGAAIGLGLLRLRLVLGLGLIGALGGVISREILIIDMDSTLSFILWQVLLAGIISGALLGATLGLLERGKTEA
jgi:hypothetical protein